MRGLINPADGLFRDVAGLRTSAAWLWIALKSVRFLIGQRWFLLLEWTLLSKRVIPWSSWTALLRALIWRHFGLELGFQGVPIKQLRSTVLLTVIHNINLAWCLTHQFWVHIDLPWSQVVAVALKIGMSLGLGQIWMTVHVMKPWVQLCKLLLLVLLLFKRRKVGELLGLGQVATHWLCLIFDGQIRVLVRIVNFLDFGFVFGHEVILGQRFVVNLLLGALFAWFLRLLAMFSRVSSAVVSLALWLLTQSVEGLF